MEKFLYIDHKKSTIHVGEYTPVPMDLVGNISPRNRHFRIVLGFQGFELAITFLNILSFTNGA